jgi:hypothetical protein
MYRRYTAVPDAMLPLRQVSAHRAPRPVPRAPRTAPRQAPALLLAPRRCPPAPCRPSPPRAPGPFCFLFVNDIKETPYFELNLRTHSSPPACPHAWRVGARAPQAVLSQKQPRKIFVQAVSRAPRSAPPRPAINGSNAPHP